MTTASQTSDGLPLSEGQGKPTTESTPKPAAAKLPKKPSTKAEGITTKAPLVNHVWAEEITAEFGLTGQLSKNVAAKLSSELSKDIAERYTRQKLVKLVRKAVQEAIA